MEFQYVRLQASSMLYQHVVRQWDLLSEVPRGLFDSARVNFGAEWDKLDEERKKAFSQLPPFDPNVSDVLKQKTRLGIPHTQRRKMWMISSGGLNLLMHVGDVWKTSKAAADQVPEFRATYFGNSIDVLTFLPPAIQREVKQFLHVLRVQNPTIDFAPLIPISASLLLLYMEKPLAYITIQSMINRSQQDSWYFTTSVSKFLAAVSAYRDILKRKCESVVKHGSSLGLDVALIAMGMLPTFFFPFMPLPVALTLFDSFMVEGRKVMMRFCIELFTSEKKSLLDTKSSRDFISVIINAIERLGSIETMKSFLKSAYRTHLSRSKCITKPEAAALSNRSDLMTHATGSTVEEVVMSVRVHVRAKSMDHYPDSDEDLSETVIAIHEHLANRTLPVIHGGKLLTDALYCALRYQLPPVLTRYSVNLVYSRTVNGCSFHTLFDACNDETPYIIMVKTTYGVFGALLSDPLRDTGEYCGKAVTFVFDGQTQEIYRKQPPGNDMFMMAKHNMVVIGGPKPAISLSQGMKRMESFDCETFESPSFMRNENGDEIEEVELYTLATVPIPNPPV